MSEIIPFRKTPVSFPSEESVTEILVKCKWQLLISLIASMAVHALFFGDYYLTYDDAYVFHVYARNLSQGHGFSFNPGEVSHAATPLLTFLLAAQHFIFGDGALISGKIMNMIFSFGSTVLLFLIAYRISENSFIAFGAAVVWATSPLAAILSAGPQDFTLFTFLVLLSLYWYLHHPQSLWTYFFLSLVILTRYEGALYAGLLYLNHLYIDWKAREFQWRNVVLRALLIGFVPLIWFTYISSHSTLLPSSGSAKLNPWALRKIPHFIAGMVIFFFPPLIVAAVVSALFKIRERFGRLMFLFIWVSFCLFFYGPFLDNRRYYVHLLPFLALFSLMYLRTVAERYFHSSRLSQAFVYATIGLTFFGYFATNIYYYQQTRGENRLTAYPAYREAGSWLKSNTPKDATFASEEIGVIPYFAERKLVDFSGWLDLESKKFREKQQGGINPKMLDYLATKRPDYLIVSTDLLSETHEKMLATDPRLTLEHQVPLLRDQNLLIYSVQW